MTNRVSLDDVTAGQFNELVEMLSRWVSEKQLTVRFWMPSTIVLDYDQEELAEVLRTRKLPVGACISQLTYDIPVMLSAVLMGRRNYAVEFLTRSTELTEPGTEDENLEELVREELTERIKVLEGNVVTEELRHRYAVKATSNNSIYTGVAWEVVKRQSHSGGDSPPNLTYATINIITQQPQIGSVTIPGTRSQESESLALTMTAHDILDLKTSLENVLTALGESNQSSDEPL